MNQFTQKFVEALALDRVSLCLVVTDICHRQRHRFSVGNDVRCLVSMARGRAIFWSHRAEFALLFIVVAVVGVVDEVHRDDSQLLSVENRQSEVVELEVSTDFEPPTIERVEPLRTVSSQGVPACSLQVSQIEVSLPQARITTSQISRGRGGLPRHPPVGAEKSLLPRYL